MGARILLDQGDKKCLRWGMWKDHWEKCVPLAVAEDTSERFAIFAIYLTWVGALWTVPHTVNREKLEESMEEQTKVDVDEVTRSAMEMKVLVLRQVETNKANERMKDKKGLVEALTAILCAAKETEAGQAAMGKMEEELGELGEQ